jgi:predicted AAA+ superfamily ATPase
VRSHFAQKPYLNLELPDMRQRIMDSYGKQPTPSAPVGRAIARRKSSQLLNLSELGRDAGISHTTARGWLSIIEQASAINAIEIKSSATFSF